MKKILLLLISISIFCVTENSLAQNENKLIEYNEFTELIDVTYFYENGAIMQKGSFNIDGLPHGLWMSYTMEGKELCSGNYKNGMRVGKWYFQLENETQSVDYFNSKIISVEENDFELAEI